jgi:hypothetical protein
MSSTFLSSCQAGNTNCKLHHYFYLIHPNFHFKHSRINQFNQQSFLICVLFKKKNLQAASTTSAPLVPRRGHHWHLHHHHNSGDANPTGVITTLTIRNAALKSAETCAPTAGYIITLFSVEATYGSVAAQLIK